MIIDLGPMAVLSCDLCGEIRSPNERFKMPFWGYYIWVCTKCKGKYKEWNDRY